MGSVLLNWADRLTPRRDGDRPRCAEAGLAKGRRRACAERRHRGRRSSRQNQRQVFPFPDFLAKKAQLKPLCRDLSFEYLIEGR